MIVVHTIAAVLLVDRYFELTALDHAQRGWIHSGDYRTQQQRQCFGEDVRISLSGFELNPGDARPPYFGQCGTSEQHSLPTADAQQGIWCACHICSTSGRDPYSSRPEARLGLYYKALNVLDLNVLDIDHRVQQFAHHVTPHRTLGHAGHTAGALRCPYSHNTTQTTATHGKYRGEAMLTLPPSFVQRYLITMPARQILKSDR